MATNKHILCTVPMCACLSAHGAAIGFVARVGLASACRVTVSVPVRATRGRVTRQDNSDFPLQMSGFLPTN